jgi:hypothetical protein
MVACIWGWGTQAYAGLVLSLSLSLSLSLYTGGTGIWIQGIVLARQAVYHSNHIFSLCFGYFGDRVSHFAQASLDPILLC